MINKALLDFKVLLYLSIMGLKNRFLEALKNPLKVAGAVLQILFLAAIFFLPYFLKGEKNNLIPDIRIYKPYFGGVFLAAFALIIFQSLRKAAKSYLPGSFNKADVNLLFTSLISKRTVYFYSFLRSFAAIALMLLIFSVIILAAAGSFRLPLLWGNTAYAIGGLFLFIIFIQSARFFIYSFNKKYKKEGLIKFVLFSLSIALLIWFLLTYFYSEKSLLGFINALDKVDFEWIPVIGWTKGLLTSLLYGSPNLIYYLILNALAAFMSTALSVIWADDYFEDAGEHLNRVDEIKDAALKGDYVPPDSDSNKTGTLKVKLSYEGMGARAFFWKELLILLRNSQGKKLSILWYLLFTFMGAVLAYALKDEKASFIALLSLLGGYMIALISMEIKGLSYEMKHIYFYTLPGSTKSKMLWISVIPFLKISAQYFLFLLPFVFFKNISLFQLASVYAAFCSFAAVKACEKLIKQIVMPDNSKNIILAYVMGIAQLLFNTPGLLFGGLAYFLTRNFALALLLFVPGEIISVFLMLIISEKLFNRAELRSNG